MTIPVRQSTAFETAIGPVLDADGVAVTDCVVGDFKIKKTTGNFAALNASATLTHVSAGMYDLVLTTSDVDTVGLNTVAIDDTVNACAPLYLQVIEEGNYDALYAASANAWSGAAGSSIGVANVTQFGGSNGTFSSGRPEVKLGDVAHGGSAAVLTMERVIVTATTANQPAISLVGNGSQPGLSVQGGATGNGMTVNGGATSGAGIKVITSNGHALWVDGNGANNAGLLVQSGASYAVQVAGITGGFSISGDEAVVISGGAVGVSIVTSAGNAVQVQGVDGHGVSIEASGTNKHGVTITGGTAGTSDGLKLTAGTGGVGFRLDTLTASGAVTLSGAVSLGSTLTVTGAITATNASNNLTLGTFTVTTNAIAWNANWDTEVQSEATDALNAYDPPTNAEMVARTLAAADYFDPAADTVANVTTVATVTNPVTAGTVSDKTGYALSATGLNSITASDPGGVASTFPQMVVQLWRRFFKKSTLTSTQLKTYADDGSTVRTTQTVSDDGTTQDQGAAS